MDATLEEGLEELTIINIQFQLTWTDEANSEPDTFRLTTDDGVNSPKGDESNGGTITVSWDDQDLNNIWNMVVACENAGPTRVPIGPLGFITQEQEDPGNNWRLEVTYTYIEGMDGPGGPPAYVKAVLGSPVFKVHIALMILSTILFLLSGIFAGIFLLTRKRWANSNEFYKKLLATPTILLFLVILAFVAFFLASVPIGMWVAGMMYGWNKAWTGFPALWNPEAFEFTNADNVSFIVLLLWAIPLYLNRSQIMKSKWFKKFFGWSNFIMKRAEKAPNPKLNNFELALCYFFMGFFVYLVFMVQPHGSS